MGELTDGPAIGVSVNWPGNPTVFSPDGKLLAVAMDNGLPTSENHIDLFDTATWKKVAVLEGHMQRITALAFSADSKFLVSGSMDTSAMVWDVSRGDK